MTSLVILKDPSRRVCKRNWRSQREQIRGNWINLSEMHWGPELCSVYSLSDNIFNWMPNDSRNSLGITPARTVVFLVPEPWSFYFIKESEKVTWIKWSGFCQFQMEEAKEKLDLQAPRQRWACMIVRDGLYFLPSLWQREMRKANRTLLSKAEILRPSKQSPLKQNNMPPSTHIIHFFFFLFP